MGLLLFALNVPLTMMCGLVSERASRRDAVVQEIRRDWGGSQTVSGPVLSVPYRHSWTDAQGRAQSATSLYHFLPDALAIDGTIEPGERKRSLFTVIVYTARLKIRGRFAPPRLADFKPTPDAVMWSDATLSRGCQRSTRHRARRRRDLEREAAALRSGREHDPASSRPGCRRRRTASTPIAPSAIPFELDLEIKGTREFRVLPAGNETTMRLASAWPHPSFVGTTPDPPRVDANGFAAAWRVPYFGRGFPPRWNAADQPLAARIADQAGAAAFGVALIQPVDIYVQSDRAVKYATLFIVLTFVIAFVWEVTGGCLVHPIQYLFVGFTMCVFYLLLLSLAEHVGFDTAYAAAATATIGLLAWYWSWVLGGRRQGAADGQRVDGAVRLPVSAAAARGLRAPGRIGGAVRDARAADVPDAAGELVRAEAR